MTDINNKPADPRPALQEALSIPFGSVVSSSEGASTIDQLVAWVGRDPAK